MANEATVHSSLQIRSSSGSLNYRTARGAFTADVAGNKGPVPGALTVPVGGVNVDLSGLTYPGLCVVSNLEAVGAATYVRFGVSDGSSFYPVIELLPGESYAIRLPRTGGVEYAGTGTNADVNTFHLRSYGGTSVVSVEAFER